MSKHDFTLDEFFSRRQRVRHAMMQQGLDWLIAFHPVSIHWLTGSDAKSYQEFQCLIISATSNDLTVITRDGETAEFHDDAYVDQVIPWGGGKVEDPLETFRRACQQRGLLSGRVGIEVPAYYLHPYHYLGVREILGSALVAEPTQLIHDLKLVKSPRELEYIREASRIADGAMVRFVEVLREGRTELAIAGDVYQSLLQNGSGLAASPINLVSGERSGFSHGAPTLRQLRRGDFGSIEFGSTFRRYTATIGRQFCLGPPSARMQELYDVVRRASDACMACLRPGVLATQPHEAARRIIADAGLERGRVHTSGYGLAPGFPPSWGEPLHMLDKSDYTLEEGMVITVEPPVFLGDERLGARLIDNVLITATGAELLGRFSRDLIQV